MNGGLWFSSSTFSVEIPNFPFQENDEVLKPAMGLLCVYCCIINMCCQVATGYSHSLLYTSSVQLKLAVETDVCANANAS